MHLIQVFEPPMCCSTGVCGPEIDPLLVQFAADVDAVRNEQVKVERFNLSQNPKQFATTPAILSLLHDRGTGALPAIVVDGQVVHHGSYPDRATLTSFASAAQDKPFAPPSTVERARSALESGRNVFLSMAGPNGGAFLEPFRRLAANPPFGQEIDLIELTAANEEDRSLMEEVGLAQDEGAAAVLLIPPGYIAAQWRGAANADDILVRLLQASARCAPGGGCCS